MKNSVVFVSVFASLWFSANAAVEVVKAPAGANALEALLADYVAQFNADDDECYTNVVANSEALAVMRANCPLFTCPDKEIERTYYFRWWTFRKHLRRDLGIWTLSEFLPNVSWAGTGNMIVCAAGHHLREGRWLRNPQFIASLARFWLADERSSSCRWGYSSWLFTGTCGFAEVSGMDSLPDELLNSAVSYYRTWEGGRYDGEMGGDGQGGFISRDGNEGTEVSLGGSGYKPLMATAMWSEAKMIAAVARKVGRTELAEEFEAKAETNRLSIIDHCWNGERNFFTTATRAGVKGTVRELHGYAPWYFGMPTGGRGPDFAQLFDTQGFAAQYGLSFPERRAPGFTIAYAGHECQWNGPSWPMSTSFALTAYANHLHSLAGDRTDAERNGYHSLLHQYATQQRREKDGRTICWIDENLNPDTGDWIARTLLKSRNQPPYERGKDYNHSTYCDLVITGLVGFIPRGANGFSVEPLFPSDWASCRLERLRYRRRDIVIDWNRDTTGLTVTVDGREVAKRATLGRVDINF